MQQIMIVGQVGKTNIVLLLFTLPSFKVFWHTRDCLQNSISVLNKLWLKNNTYLLLPFNLLVFPILKSYFQNLMQLKHQTFKTNIFQRINIRYMNFKLKIVYTDSTSCQLVCYKTQNIMQYLIISRLHVGPQCGQLSN